MTNDDIFDLVFNNDKLEAKTKNSDNDIFSLVGKNKDETYTSFSYSQPIMKENLGYHNLSVREHSNG